MTARVAYALIFILASLTAASTARIKAGGDLAGKWAGQEFPQSFVVQRGPGAFVLGPEESRQSEQCVGQTLRGNGHLGDCFPGPVVKSSKPVQLELQIESVNAKMRGSITLPERFGAGKGCGKLTIEAARYQDGRLEFTTYQKVNGVRIPTVWYGTMSDPDQLTLRTDDPSSCAGPPMAVPLVAPLFGSGMRGNFLDLGAPAATLAYKRGEPSDKREGLGGKWWTTEGNHQLVLDLKVHGNKKVSGSVNVCGIAQMDISAGEVADRRITFQIPWFGGALGGPAPRGGTGAGGAGSNMTVWNGELIEAGRLMLTSPAGFGCMNDRPRTIVLKRLR